MPLFLYKYKLLKPYVGDYLVSSNKVLGLSDIKGNYITPFVYEKDTDDIPLTPSPTLNTVKPKNTKSNKSTSKSSTPNNLVIVTPPPALSIVLENKLTLIIDYVKFDTTEPDPLKLQAIFEEQLLKTFGLEEVGKIFNDITQIKFINPKIAGTEALVTAEVTKKSEVKNYTCYFVYKNNDWYLYKTVLE